MAGSATRGPSLQGAFPPLRCVLIAKSKLKAPVLAVAGEQGIGANHEALVRAFASNLVDNLIVSGARHFVPEDRRLASAGPSRLIASSAMSCARQCAENMKGDSEGMLLRNSPCSSCLP